MSTCWLRNSVLVRGRDFCQDINDKCPKCGGENIQQLRRVTGYLTGNYKTAFNKGKQQEVEMRVRHLASKGLSL